MKVFTVTKDFMSSIVGLFSRVGETSLLPTDYRTIEGFEADLIVFAGGEDINPARYKADSRNGWYNDKRDEWELKVLKDIVSGKLKTKKVLGICRGLQLINVGLGGSLIYDIFEHYNISHEGYHPLKHITNNYNHVFEFLPAVNSMHHQCIRVKGDTPKYIGRILAVEPTTSSVEIISWGDAMLGFQFHPEFFPDDNEFKWKIAETIRDWSVGNLSIVSSRKRVTEKPAYYGNVYNAPIAWDTEANMVGASESLEINQGFRGEIPSLTISTEEGAGISISSARFTPTEDVAEAMRTFTDPMRSVRFIEDSEE